MHKNQRQFIKLVLCFITDHFKTIMRSCDLSKKVLTNRTIEVFERERINSPRYGQNILHYIAYLLGSMKRTPESFKKVVQK